jgi:hypothetical protein
MSSISIFVLGSGVSLLCLTGLVLSIMEMKRLGRGGGERALSMAIVPGPQRATRDRNTGS